jgi:DNA-binding response OmpR family regulator
MARKKREPTPGDAGGPKRRPANRQPIPADVAESRLLRALTESRGLALSRTAILKKVFKGAMPADQLDHLIRRLEHAGKVRLKEVTRTHVVSYKSQVVELLPDPPR